MDTHNYKAASFQAIKHKFALHLGMPCDSELEEERVFAGLHGMRSYNEQGDIVKLNRWLSIGECWNGHGGKPGLRHEVWGSKVILEYILDRQNLGDGTLLEPQTDRTNATEIPDGGEDHSYIARSHAWVCPYSIFVMDAFSLVSKSLHAAYSHRASQVKTPAALLQHNLRRQRAGISAELVDIANNELFDEV